MTANRLSGLVFLGLGLWTCWKAVELSLGSLQSPGAGLYPLMVGIGMAALGAVLMSEGALYARAPGHQAPAPRSPNLRIVAATAGALLVYIALFRLLGFAPTTFVLLLTLLRFGRMGWGRAAGASAALVVATLVAARALNIPLPAGSLFS